MHQSETPPPQQKQGRLRLAAPHLQRVVRQHGVVQVVVRHLPPQRHRPRAHPPPALPSLAPLPLLALSPLALPLLLPLGGRLVVQRQHAPQHSVLRAHSVGQRLARHARDGLPGVVAAVGLERLAHAQLAVHHLEQQQQQRRQRARRGSRGRLACALPACFPPRRAREGKGEGEGGGGRRGAVRAVGRGRGAQCRRQGVCRARGHTWCMSSSLSRLILYRHSSCTHAHEHAHTHARRHARVAHDARKPRAAPPPLSTSACGEPTPRCRRDFKRSEPRPWLQQLAPRACARPAPVGSAGRRPLTMVPLYSRR